LPKDFFYLSEYTIIVCSFILPTRNILSLFAWCVK